ncbi:MAG: hypothetical protein U9N86_02750 [Bacteroidota bacterium]|nr:hypothetical protein [Bacteroidota bacterium]
MRKIVFVFLVYSTAIFAQNTAFPERILSDSPYDTDFVLFDGDKVAPIIVDREEKIRLRMVSVLCSSKNTTIMCKIVHDRFKK